MYSLSTVLTVSDGYNFTISSTNATVTCISATAKFEFNRVQKVYINGMTFQGCRNTAIRMTQVTSASIIRSNFINNQVSRSGGCLYITSSSVNICESAFQNNRAGYSRGAIYARSSTVIIKKSLFSYNRQENMYGSGDDGGAIHASNSNITVNGSVLTYNSVSGSFYYTGGGGAITMCCEIFQVIINTMFIGNRAFNRGGAISIIGKSTIVTQCQFIDNYVNGMEEDFTMQ